MATGTFEVGWRTKSGNTPVTWVEVSAADHSEAGAKAKAIIDPSKHHFSVITAEDQKQRQLTDSDEEDIAKIKEEWAAVRREHELELQELDKKYPPRAFTGWEVLVPEEWSDLKREWELEFWELTNSGLPLPQPPAGWEKAFQYQRSNGAEAGM